MKYKDKMTLVIDSECMQPVISFSCDFRHVNFTAIGTKQVFGVFYKCAKLITSVILWTYFFILTYINMYFEHTLSHF